MWSSVTRCAQCWISNFTGLSSGLETDIWYTTLISSVSSGNTNCPATSAVTTSSLVSVEDRASWGTSILRPYLSHLKDWGESPWIRNNVLLPMYTLWRVSANTAIWKNQTLFYCYI